MKRNLLYLMMMAMLTFALPSCGNDDDEPDSRIKVSQTEIQGTWYNLAYKTYHRFSFTGNDYFYLRMDSKTQDITYMESGTYTLNGIDITFKSSKGDSKLGKCEIYWETSAKNQLHIYPIGTYIKVD